MTELFLDKFRALVPAYFEEPWVPEDGLSEDELAELREGQDFPLPMAVHEFYLAVGASEDLMEAFHYVWDSWPTSERSSWKTWMRSLSGASRQIS